MPPRPAADALALAMARLVEAVNALSMSGQIRQQQVADLVTALNRVEAELRRHGDAEAAAARTVGDLNEGLKRREDADARALADLRATKAEGGAHLATLLRHPVVVPLLSALLTAAAMWFGVRPDPTPTPGPHPAPSALETAE